MKKRHIAFVIYPHYPNVGPTLPFASVLARRGYRVTYVTSNRFAPRIAALDIEVVPCSLHPYTLSDWEPDEKGTYRRQLDAQTASMLQDIESFYRANRPDVIVYDLSAYAGYIIASRLNIPAIRTSPSFAHHKEYHDRQVRNAGFRATLVDVSRQIDELLGRFGVETEDWIFRRERLNIFLFPEALQPCAELIGDSRCFYAGRCAGEQPYYGNWQLKSGKPVALVSSSTLYVRDSAYFRMCIEALSSLDLHIVLSIGDNCDPASLNPLPPSCEIVQGTSHVKILPHASIFVCSGGIVTAAEAAYHGVPLVVTTHGFPELEWSAERFAEIGLGVHLGKTETSTDSIRDAALRLTKEARFQVGLEGLKRCVRRESGAEETANRIEDYLTEYCA